MISTKKIMKIADVNIGNNCPCQFIAEIGLNHNGEIKLAHKLIDEAKASGAKFVKFQKRCIEDLADSSFLDAPFTKCPAFGSTQREVRNKLELSIEALKELEAHAKSLDLLFFVSAFDIPSLHVALSLNHPVIKVASHSVTNEALLKELSQSKIPVIMSLGASSLSEKRRAVETLSSNPLVLLHCVSAYPTPPQLVKLDTIRALEKEFGVPVGYSGHEDGIDISVAASILGACLIERHFTLSRKMVGVDHAISLEPSEFREMVNKTRLIEACRGIKSEVYIEESGARLNYHVSIHTARALQIGDILTENDLVLKQPLIDEEKYFRGYELSLLIGKRVTEQVEADRPLPRKCIS